jgi:predicted nucleotidyltransferase
MIRALQPVLYSDRARYMRAREVARRLCERLVHIYGARRVVLIGSCLREDRFGPHSDIDLCVEGLYGLDYLTALGDLLIEAGEFDVDLVPIEEASEGMRAEVAAGEVLYEQR